MIALFIMDSQRVTVHNCHFWDIGYHGVMMRGANAEVLVDNNEFAGCGISRWACVGTVFSVVGVVFSQFEVI